jgi:proteasome lid subunit RPN8/RPN11
MGLILPDPVRDELIAHAREGDPDEVCGILAGQGERVERLFRVRNTADQVEAERSVFRDRESGQPIAGRKAAHYYMDPRDQLRVYNEIDDLGLIVVAYYHSHTGTEARPSPTDIRLASDLAAHYVLVSLQDKQRPVVRAWKIVKADPAAESGEAVEQEIRSED